jgi:hypothetical protein
MGPPVVIVSSETSTAAAASPSATEGATAWIVFVPVSIGLPLFATQSANNTPQHLRKGCEDSHTEVLDLQIRPKPGQYPSHRLVGLDDANGRMRLRRTRSIIKSVLKTMTRMAHPRVIEFNITLTGDKLDTFSRVLPQIELTHDGPQLGGRI